MALEELKKLPTITEAQIKAYGVTALADRPNLAAQYGQSGLTAGQLKAWFDQLAVIISKRLSDISGAFASTEAGNYIRIALDNYGEIYSLAELVTAFTDGTFADNVLRVSDPLAISAQDKKTLQYVLNEFANKLTNFDINITSYIDEKIEDLQENDLQPIRDSVATNTQSIGNLNTEVKKLEEIAKGAQAGRSFKTYGELVETLNKAENTALLLNQSVYIETEDVPDLWVSVISTDKKAYAYSDEYAFAKDLHEKKRVQVGYFIFARLETDKVVLENYYTKDETNSVVAQATVKIVRLI